ncbi:CATRA system-associated protein [Herbidospora sp. RD11066]
MPDALHADLLELLEDVLAWQLSPARWDGVAALVDSISSAHERGDRDELAAAIAELDLLGPVRMHRIGDAPVVPPPPKVREWVNRLVHAVAEEDAE